MIVIGMFHFRKDPDKVTRAYSYASIAKMEGVEFFYFTAKDVDLSGKKINGSYYDSGKWLKKEFDFPDVIVNVVGPITPKQKEIYYELNKLIPFTAFPVGTKLSVYNKIKKGKDFSDYLIPYQRLKNPVEVLKFINEFPKAVIKPISGNHGNKIVFVEHVGDNYLINDSGIKLSMNKMEFFDYAGQLLSLNKMVIQKYISCRKKTGEAYDFRLHLQKDKEGNWKNTVIYPKIGSTEKIATNLGQGGQIAVLDCFLAKEFQKESTNVKRYLEVFAIQFANHFDKLYKYEFDELGIDVGLDEEMKLWIYEVNWRPGHMFIELKTAKYAISYAIYLATKQVKE